jgi:transcriptional regulator with XRE-family HTH domain
MPDHPRREFSERLRALMEKEGLSQYRLAEEVGAKQSAVAMWLSKGSVPFRPTMVRLCARFGVNKEWLVDGIGPKDAPKSKTSLDTFPRDLRTDLEALGEAAQNSKDVRQIVAHLAHVFRKQ